MRTTLMGLGLLASLLLSPALVLAQDDAGTPDVDAGTPDAAPAAAQTLHDLADDAPLSDFVAQRDVVLSSRRGAERGLGMEAAMPLLQGVADFLVSRAEAEVEAYASGALAAQVCTEQTLLPILPNTCGILRSWGEADGTSGRARLEALVAALRMDLRALPADVMRMVLQHVQGNEAEHVRLFFALVVETVDAVLANATPEDLADRVFRLALHCDIHATGGDAAVDCHTPEGRVWQRDFLRVSNLVRLALDGSLDDETLAAVLPTGGGAQSARLRTDAARLLADVRASQQAVRDLRDASGDAAREAALGKVVAARLVAIVVDGVVAVEHAKNRAETTDRTREQFLLALRTAAQTAIDGSPTAALAATVDLVRASIAMLVASDPALVARLQRSLGVPPGVLTALTTVVALADAHDRDAARAILEQISAPVGSWRAKRRGPMVSVMGLVGFAGLYDQLSLHGSFAGAPSTFGVALHASIGVDFNIVGHHDAGTFGIYVAAIDVGAIASAPFGLEVEHVKVEVDRLQLVSPGAYLRWGLFDTPLVLAAGASFVPHARRLEQVSPTGEVTTAALDAVRFEVVLAIDTTLWVL